MLLGTPIEDFGEGVMAYEGSLTPAYSARKKKINFSRLTEKKGGVQLRPYGFT